MNKYIKKNQEKKIKERDKDFHYTNENMVKDLMKIIPFKKNDIVLDAGSGKNKVFYNNIPIKCKKNECEIEDGCDFLKWDKKIDWCVSDDTEFFNGKKWIRMDKYNGKDKVLSFKECGNAVLIKPKRYIKKKYNGVWIETNSSNLSFNVVGKHRMLLITSKNNFIVKNAEDIKSSYYRIPTSFYFNGNLVLSEKELRIATMIIADGWKHHCKNKYVIEVKKERKKERARRLLKDFDFTETFKKNGYSRFCFSFPLLKTKNFPLEWFNLNKKSKEIILDEIFYWDGTIKNSLYKNKTYIIKRFYTTNIKTLDFIQFIASSIGKSVTIVEDNHRDKICYIINITDKKNARLHKFKKINKVNKYCYCFEVATDNLILRYNKKIFITKNCIGNPPFDIGWKFIEKASEISKKGIAFLGNINFFNSLTPKRLEFLKEKGFTISKIHLVADKRWYGRYYFIIFTKDDNNVFSWNPKTYK